MSENNTVDLRIAGPNDKELEQLLESDDLLKFMSETRSYAVPMPTSITFRVEYNGTLAGEAKIKSIRWFNRKAEVSLYLAPRFRRKGLGKAAMRNLLSYAFLTLDLHRVEAEIYEYNEQSAILAEKLGFVKEGVLREAKFYSGKYYDILRYGLLKKEFDS
jgi:RimJ/RimL family protein N-acetyltransferase